MPFVEEEEVVVSSKDLVGLENKYILVVEEEVEEVAVLVVALVNNKDLAE